MQGIHGGDIYRNEVMLDFSININPFGMPGEAGDALRQAAGLAAVYPDPAAQELTLALSEALGVERERLVFGNGASELFMAVVHAIKPKKTVIPVPSFSGYSYAAEAAGSEITYVTAKSEDDFFPGQALLEALTEDTELLFLANPNNPTGKLLSREYLREVLLQCEQKNIYVVLDECFIEFCDETATFLPEADKPHLLLVRAFTKSYALAGVRLGYLLGNDRELLQKIRRQLPEWNLSVFAQKAGIACLKAKDYLKNTVAYLKMERQRMVEQLQGLGLTVYAGEADFVLFYSEIPLGQALLKRGILIRDCSNFIGLKKGYYRVAIKTREENEQLWRAIGECIEQDRTFTSGGN